MINNMKLIREIYGATQNDIAKIIGVSRVTISKWEKDTENKVPYAVLEKLSLFYGVGPECFYEKKLDDRRKELIITASERAKEIDSENEASKEDKFRELFLNTTFDEAISKYMFSMKVLLALSDEGKLDDLKIVYKINEKMNKRLEAIISLKEEDDDSINDLIEQLSIDL